MHTDDLFLSQKQLARRWGISYRTLERWRCLGGGPRFLKIGRRVTYRLCDIHTFEAEQVREGGQVQAAPQP